MLFNYCPKMVRNKCRNGVCNLYLHFLSLLFAIFKAKSKKVCSKFILFSFFASMHIILIKLFERSLCPSVRPPLSTRKLWFSRNLIFCKLTKVLEYTNTLLVGSRKVVWGHVGGKAKPSHYTPN